MDRDLVRLQEVRLGYGRHAVLGPLSLTIHRGDFLGVMGPNGSGKTTLLKAIARLIRPLAGTIEIASDGVSPHFGYVPQRERLDIHFPLTALQIAVMGRYGRLGALRRPRVTDYDAALDCLRRVNLADKAGFPYRQLSGGQQQRVLIARALAGEPEALLLDEPTNGMDLEAERAIMELLIALRNERNTTIIFVTHLLSAVEHYAQRVALITAEGRLETGSKEMLLAPENLHRAYASGER